MRLKLLVLILLVFLGGMGCETLKLVQDNCLEFVTQLHHAVDEVANLSLDLAGVAEDGKARETVKYLAIVEQMAGLGCLFVPPPEQTGTQDLSSGDDEDASD